MSEENFFAQTHMIGILQRSQMTPDQLFEHYTKEIQKTLERFNSDKEFFSVSPNQEFLHKSILKASMKRYEEFIQLGESIEANLVLALLSPEPIIRELALKISNSDFLKQLQIKYQKFLLEVKVINESYSQSQTHFRAKNSI